MRRGAFKLKEGFWWGEGLEVRGMRAEVISERLRGEKEGFQLREG